MSIERAVCWYPADAAELAAIGASLGVRTNDHAIQRDDGSRHRYNGASWVSASFNPILLDTRSSPITTPSAAPAGTAEGTIAATVDRCRLTYLRISAASVTQVEIRFFADSARTLEIYKAPFSGSHDFTGGDYYDRNPATLIDDDGAGLESNSVYYRISNTGGTGSTFDIRLILEQ